METRSMYYKLEGKKAYLILKGTKLNNNERLILWRKEDN